MNFKLQQRIEDYFWQNLTESNDCITLDNSAIGLYDIFNGTREYRVINLKEEVQLYIRERKQKLLFKIKEVYKIKSKKNEKIPGKLIVWNYKNHATFTSNDNTTTINGSYIYKTKTFISEDKLTIIKCK